MKKLKKTNTCHLKIRVLVVLLFMMKGIAGNSQTMEYLGNGNYEFDTDFPASDLHFYLFDDGYHSFDKNVVHTYSNSSLPATPTLYYKESYQSGDPDLIVFNEVDCF